MSTKSTPNTAESLLATGEQVEHIMDMWCRRLKSRNLTLEEAQMIITAGNRYLPVMDKAADILVDQVRTEGSNIITRMVRNIRRNRTAWQGIDATGRQLHGSDKVLATMPVGDGPEEVELVYVRAGRVLSPAEQVIFLDEQGLKSDPQAQMADNEQDPSFGDEHPNGFQWDPDGQTVSFVFFSLDDGERNVYVYRRHLHWGDDDWFCGVRKPVRRNPVWVGKVFGRLVPWPVRRNSV